MVRDHPVYDKTGRIAFYSAPKYPHLRGEDDGWWIRVSWINYMFAPADSIYYRLNSDSFLMKRSRDPRYAAEFSRRY